MHYLYCRCSRYTAFNKCLILCAKWRNLIYFTILSAVADICSSLLLWSRAVNKFCLRVILISPGYSINSFNIIIKLTWLTSLGWDSVNLCVSLILEKIITINRLKCARQCKETKKLLFYHRKSWLKFQFELSHRNRDIDILKPGLLHKTIF